MICYGMKHKSDDVLEKSSSGGAFTAISDLILERGGVVFGAIYNYENDLVQHVGTNEIEVRNKMRGSKYIQSEMNNSFSEVKDLLLLGKEVLFTGTICQIAGLKSYLSLNNCPMDKLILCDIICHGVGSPQIWTEIINQKKKENKINVFESIQFRDKQNGWCASHTIGISDGKKIEIPEFMNLFYGHGIMRESCYSCHFTNLDRCSDITIGDFWGVENSIPEFYSNEGVSFVMVNSEKGQKVTDFLKNNGKVDMISADVQMVNQPNFYHPAKRSVIKDRLWKNFQDKGIGCVLSVYANDSLFSKIKLKVLKIVDGVRKLMNDD